MCVSLTQFYIQIFELLLKAIVFASSISSVAELLAKTVGLIFSTSSTSQLIAKVVDVIMEPIVVPTKLMIFCPQSLNLISKVAVLDPKIGILILGITIGSSKGIDLVMKVIKPCGSFAGPSA